MNNAKTGLDLVEFCRPLAVFKDWPPVQLTSSIARAVAENTLVYSVNELGQIDGICIGQLQPHNVMHIVAIHAPRGVMLRVFLPIFKQRFPGYTLTGYRRKHNILTKYQFHG